MKELKRVPSNKGVEQEYKRKLNKLVKVMSASVMYWVLVRYGERTPYEMAIAIRKRIKQWDKIFGNEAQKIAEWFVNSVKKHTEIGMANAFTSVGYKMKHTTPNEVMKAIEYENIELIKSIPEKYFIGVKEVALLSLMYGWSKEKLNEELIKRKQITERRVKTIASDQTHKTTELIKVGLCKSNKIKYCRWVYTWRSEKPRENHIMMNGQIFDIETGAITPDGDEYIYPAQKINCKCDFRPIIEEFGDDLKREMEIKTEEARKRSPY